MMIYWAITNSALTGFRKMHGLTTTHSHFAKESPKPKLPANRSTRRYLKSKHGITDLTRSWKTHSSNRTGAAVADLVSLAARAGNEWATEYGLATRIEALEPEVERIISEGDDIEGVIIVGKYQQWVTPDFNGVKAKSALSARIAAAGISPGEAINTWDENERRNGSISVGAPRGWTVKSLVFWAVLGDAS